MHGLTSAFHPLLAGLPPSVHTIVVQLTICPLASILHPYVSSVLTTLLNLICGVILALLALKLYEMWVHCYLAARLRSLRQANESCVVRPWPVTSSLLKLHLPSWIRPAIVRIAFRWTSLMLLTGLIVTINPTKWIVIAGSVLLITGIWSQVTQRIIFRLRLGPEDTVFRSLAAQEIRRQVSDTAVTPSPPAVTITEDIVRLFSKLFVVLVLSYASIFCGLCRLRPGVEVFHGAHDGVKGSFELLYFSIVTAATVGFGDIYPATLLARLIVASEIVAAFFFFILLLSAFSLSASSPTQTDNDLEGAGILPDSKINRRVGFQQSEEERNEP